MSRVLVIEDNPINMELVRDLLEMEGLEVLEADNAEDGIRMARTESPDLISMDVRLPGMDGLTATRLIKEDPATRSIPIVALTAQAMKEDQAKVTAAGCDGYITKPIDTRTFPEEVLRALGAAAGAEG